MRVLVSYAPGWVGNTSQSRPPYSQVSHRDAGEIGLGHAHAVQDDIWYRQNATPKRAHAVSRRSTFDEGGAQVCEVDGR